MPTLYEQNIPGASYQTDADGRSLLHVETPHALIQAIGYLKHTVQPWERVLFRGQNFLYPSLCPSLYRGIKSTSTQAARHGKVNQLVQSFSNSAGIFQNIPEYAREPLLQHYGIKTTWLDVVDNIWVAIWFAVHGAYSSGRHLEFLHFEERKVTPTDKYGYILLVKVDEDRKLSPRKGMLSGKLTETVDLRIAVPSIFLRPHAQHGLLFRKRGISVNRDLDYSSTVQAVIRFDLENGVAWLGRGTMHSIRSLFPPPYFDDGYRILLEFELKDRDFGSIHHIGA